MNPLRLLYLPIMLSLSQQVIWMATDKKPPDWPADQDISSQPPPTTTTSSDGMKTEGESGGGRGAAPLHLWEESWDDDEGDAAGGEFAAQLKAEMGRK